MMHDAPSRTTPFAFELKRQLLLYSHRLWWPIDATDAASAPIYVFPDQERFDSDEVEHLVTRTLPGTLKLPHSHCIFELDDRSFPGGRTVTYVRAVETGVESFLFRFYPEQRRWSDVLVVARFRADASGEAVIHPDLQEDDERRIHCEVARAMVLRSLALLSIDTPLAEHQLSRIRRARLAKAGMRGWTYRVAQIQPAMIAAALVDTCGTHASPRWHLRRGHWRRLADGRRIFVRECEVGDIARGGVIKDYRVAAGKVA